MRIGGAALAAACICGALLEPACKRPIISGDYGVPMPYFPDQCEGRRHPGVDFRAQIGAPVLAAADGIVVSWRETRTGGGVLLLRHEGFARYTAYAHLQDMDSLARVGARVRRGQVIGRIGRFRNSGPSAHVHLELCTGNCEWGHPSCTLEGTEDPLDIMQGCFRRNRLYPSEALSLTYPISC